MLGSVKQRRGGDEEAADEKKGQHLLDGMMRKSMREPGQQGLDGTKSTREQQQQQQQQQGCQVMRHEAG
jgi:hypothetical protein